MGLCGANRYLVSFVSTVGYYTIPPAPLPPPQNKTIIRAPLEVCTVDVPVYRPPVYRFALFTGVFFRATPSPRFTGGMPVYRGGSFFHARGAPPAAAHSYTRCCTQHNTTRWVLQAAANTCLHTMPCAAGELCQLSDRTTTPEFSCCGPCGGRLHRICGDPDDSCLCTLSTAVVTELLPSMYSIVAHSCTNYTVVAGYHDRRKNTDTPYRSLWRYICSSSARAGVFPGIPVYRFALFTGSFWSCHYRPVNRDIDCMVITYSRVWINRIKLPILLVVS